ncbi:hypothetical protein ACFL3U_03005 [Pseudomonadota bacterium]
MLTIIMLSGCEQAAEEKREVPSSMKEEVAAMAPGIITGDEALPAGHPPIEGLQTPAVDNALPTNHSAMAEIEGGTDASVRPDDEPEHPPSSGKELEVAIPDSVVGKWFSVQLEISLADGSKKEIRTVLNEETELFDLGLTVRAEIFLPAYISDFETIKSASNELTNPAVKVRLFKNQKAISVGWVFQHYPEFNSFKSDLVEFKLLSAEKKQ